MPFKSLCCCCSAATEAVAIQPTTNDDVELASPPREERLSPLASSGASSVSLAFMDAVEDLTEGGSTIGGEEGFFFVAQETLGASSEENSTMGPQSIKENVEIIAPEEEKNIQRTEIQDEELLAPHLREEGSRRKKIEALDRGFPGSLTEHQLKVYQKFRSELQSRDQIYRDMVYSFSDLEPEPYALCRYLRFCSFNVEKTFHYMDNHIAKWNEAVKHDFYPDSQKAVGVPLSVLLTQFPSLYYGNAKQGFPVCYFDTGKLSEEGLECIVDLERLPNFIWMSVMNVMRHQMYPKAQEMDPSFLRLEQITVMNLEGLSPSLFTPTVYSTLKKVDQVAGTFPEMLHTIVVLNAPSFFTFVWAVIKRFLDARTSQLIEIYSSKAKGQDRLLELIDKNQLPSDYGGLALSTSEVILREGRQGKIPRYQIVRLIKVRKKKQAEISFSLEAYETIDMSIYTRSNTAVDVILAQGLSEVTTKSVKSPDALPLCFHLGEYSGAGDFTLVASLHGDASAVQHLLVVGEVFGREDD